VELRNRFYFSPHGVALSIGSKPSTDLIHYLVERVKGGGCGLVCLSMTAHERGRSFHFSPYAQDNIPSFRAVADAVHDAGGRIFAEPWYHWTTYGHWEPLSPPAPALAPSAVQYGIGDRTLSTHEMGKDEIRAMLEVFRQSITHLRAAGFDGVMMHAAHGGLLEQFVSPYFNHRSDEYGGSLENRMRFLVESLQAARDGAAGKLAVGMRFNSNELIPGGYDAKEAREILQRVCDAGLLDFVDLDVAVEPQQLHLGMPPVFVAPHVYRPYVEAIRSAAGKVPVLSVLGRLTSLADGEAVVAAGICDMVGAARALIAEPQFVKNAFQGNEDRSRTCIACNWCLAALGDGAQGCAINPASYRERIWGVDTWSPASRRSKVVVVGAGPAGLEAARVSAIKGHGVVLFETREKLGGALAIWAALPGREFYHKSIDWWERELLRLGVDIRRGTEATVPSISSEEPDAVIVATGARYSPSGHSTFLERDIPGYEHSFVYRPEDILLEGVRPSGKVVLLDGEGINTSLGIAELLSNAGADVEYLSPGFSPISARLVDGQESRFIMKRLRTAGVRFSPCTYIRRISAYKVVTAYDVFTDEERILTGINAVVLSTGRVPVNALAKALEGKVAQLYTVGDALAARPWATAAYEGQKFARYIGEANAPRTVAEAYFRPNPPEVWPVPA